MSRHRWRLRALSLTPLLVLALCAAAPPASAQGVTAGLFPGSRSVAPGAEFDLELRVTQAGAVFNGFDAAVSYDPAALTLLPLVPVALQQGALMVEACGNTFHRFAAGASADTITDVLLCAGQSLSGPGTLYKLHFRAAHASQVTHVRLTPGTLKFYSGGLFVTPVSSTDATVGIGMQVTGVGEEPAPTGMGLKASPNPGRDTIAFTSTWRSAGTESLTVRDVQGRVVRKLDLTGHQVAWDGRSESGVRVNNGLYFATLHADGRSTTIRFSLIP